jgi:two-component system OmpR family response regulator
VAAPSSQAGGAMTTPAGTPANPPPGATRVLVVDDEPAIAELISTALGYAGYQVTRAATGFEALASAESFRPELVVLDVMLPDLDGFEVVRRLRSEGRRTPVVFLTAKDATEDKVRGLTLGGDDYVTKPFSLEELLARVEAVLRRSGVERQHASVLRVADLELDEESHEVWRAGEPIELTATEFKLLRYLMRNARRVVSKAQILDHVWHYDFDGDANVVETYVSYLRRKIDRPGSPSLIRTLRGAGYSLRVPPGGTGA